MVRVGVTVFRYVSHHHVRPWLIFSYKNVKGRGVQAQPDETDDLVHPLSLKDFPGAPTLPEDRSIPPSKPCTSESHGSPVQMIDQQETGIMITKKRPASADGSQPDKKLRLDTPIRGEECDVAGSLVKTETEGSERHNVSLPAVPVEVDIHEGLVEDHNVALEVCDEADLVMMSPCLKAQHTDEGVKNAIISDAKEIPIMSQEIVLPDDGNTQAREPHTQILYNDTVPMVVPGTSMECNDNVSINYGTNIPIMVSGNDSNPQMVIPKMNSDYDNTIPVIVSEMNSGYVTNTQLFASVTTLIKGGDTELVTSEISTYGTNVTLVPEMNIMPGCFNVPSLSTEANISHENNAPVMVSEMTLPYVTNVPLVVSELDNSVEVNVPLVVQERNVQYLNEHSMQVPAAAMTGNMPVTTQNSLLCSPDGIVSGAPVFSNIDFIIEEKSDVNTGNSVPETSLPRSEMVPHTTPEDSLTFTSLVPVKFNESTSQHTSDTTEIIPGVIQPYALNNTAVMQDPGLSDHNVPNADSGHTTPSRDVQVPMVAIASPTNFTTQQPVVSVRIEGNPKQSRDIHANIQPQTNTPIPRGVKASPKPRRGVPDAKQPEPALTRDTPSLIKSGVRTNVQPGKYLLKTMTPDQRVIEQKYVDREDINLSTGPRIVQTKPTRKSESSDSEFLEPGMQMRFGSLVPVSTPDVNTAKSLRNASPSGSRTVANNTKPSKSPHVIRPSKTSVTPVRTIAASHNSSPKPAVKTVTPVASTSSVAKSTAVTSSTTTPATSTVSTRKIQIRLPSNASLKPEDMQKILKQVQDMVKSGSIDRVAKSRAARAAKARDTVSPRVRRLSGALGRQQVTQKQGAEKPLTSSFVAHTQSSVSGTKNDTPKIQTTVVESVQCSNQVKMEAETSSRTSAQEVDFTQMKKATFNQSTDENLTSSVKQMISPAISASPKPVVMVTPKGTRAHRGRPQHRSSSHRSESDTDQTIPQVDGPADEKSIEGKGKRTKHVTPKKSKSSQLDTNSSAKDTLSTESSAGLLKSSPNSTKSPLNAGLKSDDMNLATQETTTRDNIEVDVEGHRTRLTSASKAAVENSDTDGSGTRSAPQVCRDTRSKSASKTTASAAKTHQFGHTLGVPPAKGTYQRVRLLSRPWKTPEGTVNRPILQMMLEGLLAFVMSKPGITRQGLVEKYSPILQPVPLLELVEMLELIGCANRTYIRQQGRPSLFSKRLPFEHCELEDCGEEVESVLPAADCVLKMGQFIAQFKHRGKIS